MTSTRSHTAPDDGATRIEHTTRPYAIVMPCLDDWESVRLLLPRLDAALSSHGLRGHVVLVDDGSRTRCPDDLAAGGYAALTQVDVLVLLRNLGHQRAICVALCHVVTDRGLQQCAGVVVMDADGEDDPSDVPRLIAQLEREGCAAAVFARRARRSEGFLFRMFYGLYRMLHRLLTGIPVRIGNFSVLPMPLAKRLTVVSELWNHYAAAAVHARIPMVMLPTTRASRLVGASRMNFVSLVSHGMGAMSVFADRIGVRALAVSAALVILFAIGMVMAVGIRYFTTLAIPGWATTAVGILAILLMQSLLLSLVFTFLIHLGRAGSGFLPVRDADWFVDRVELKWRRHG